MGDKRLRTAQRRKRARAKFWDRYGDAFRLTLIGGGVAIAATWILSLAMR
jgi:hypothetical protein